MTTNPTMSGARYNTGKPKYSYLLDFSAAAASNLLSLQPKTTLAFNCMHTLFKQEVFEVSTLNIAYYALYDLIPEEHRQGAEGFISLAEGINRVGVKGAVKYAPRNWQKGLSVRDCFDCAVRHLLKINNGVELDEESGEHHACHTAWNILASDWMIRNKPGFDDRAKALGIGEAPL